MRIVFFGTPDFVIPVLHSLAEHFEVVGIVTTPPFPAGRKKELTLSPVHEAFLKLDLEGVMCYPEKFEQSTIEALKKTNPDLFVVAAYGKIIPKSILDIPQYGALNIHPSLLPRYRGPSPIQTALLNGDKKSGITIIKMDEKMDHGPIIVQKEIPLTIDATFENLHRLMFTEAAELLIPSIKNYVSGKLKPVDQNDDEATYCQIITRQDGYFDIDHPPSPQKLDRMIRAFFPWPTAWTRVRIKNQERIMKFLPEKKVQLEGGKPMTLKELLNGYPEMKERLEKLMANG